MSLWNPWRERVIVDRFVSPQQGSSEGGDRGDESHMLNFKQGITSRMRPGVGAALLIKEVKFFFFLTSLLEYICFTVVC